jgi:hypothetical protein
MKQWTMVAGAILLAGLVPLALTGAGKKEAADASVRNGHFLHVGKTYSFQFLPGVTEQEFVTYKVIGEPSNGWVRVGVSEDGGAELIPTWINLQAVAVIVHDPKND